MSEEKNKEVYYEGLPSVLIIGKPNVGKSTLFNRLLHKRRSITEPTAGVTREPIEHQTFLDGKPILLIDSAGFSPRISKENKYSVIDEIAREKTLEYLKKADKLILSSRYEGFTIVLLEGLCLGKNVIASDCKTGPKEILANNRGLLFKVGDYSTLAKYIISKKNKEELEFSLEEFERNRIFEKFLEILED